MLLEGPQQTTGSIGQTWKTGNGRSRLVLTGQHKHTPPPPPPTPREPRGGDGTTRGTPPPPHQGGDPAPSTNPRPLCRPPPTHPPPPEQTNETAGGPVRPQPPTTPQSNTHTRTTHPTTRLGGHSGEATPGPIPNPEAKPPSANGTAPARTRKSRTPPSTHHPPTTHKGGGGALCINPRPSTS